MSVPTSRLGRWVWRRYWAWKLRDSKLPYSAPRNEHEDAMNQLVVDSAVGLGGPASGRADW